MDRLAGDFPAKIGPKTRSQVIWGTPVRWIGHTVSLPPVAAVPDEQLVALQSARRPVAAEQAEIPAAVPNELQVVALQCARWPVAAEQAEIPAAVLNELLEAVPNELLAAAQAELLAVQNVQPQEERE